MNYAKRYDELVEQMRSVVTEEDRLQRAYLDEGSNYDLDDLGEVRADAVDVIRQFLHLVKEMQWPDNYEEDK